MGASWTWLTRWIRPPWRRESVIPLALTVETLPVEVVSMRECPRSSGSGKRDGQISLRYGLWLGFENCILHIRLRLASRTGIPNRDISGEYLDYEMLQILRSQMSFLQPV